MTDRVYLDGSADVARAGSNISSAAEQFCRVAVDLQVTMIELIAALNTHTEALNRVSYLETQSTRQWSDLADLSNTLKIDGKTPQQIYADMQRMVAEAFRITP